MLAHAQLELVAGQISDVIDAPQDHVQRPSLKPSLDV